MKFKSTQTLHTDDFPLDDGLLIESCIDLVHVYPESLGDSYVTVDRRVFELLHMPPGMVAKALHCKAKKVMAWGRSMNLWTWPNEVFCSLDALVLDGVLDVCQARAVKREILRGNYSVTDVATSLNSSYNAASLA